MNLEAIQKMPIDVLYRRIRDIEDLIKWVQERIDYDKEILSNPTESYRKITELESRIVGHKEELLAMRIVKAYKEGKIEELRELGVKI